MIAQLSAIRCMQIGALLMLMIGASQTQAQNRFTVSADGQEVLDSTTNLSWRRCAEGMQWDGKACGGKPTNFKLAGAREDAAAAGKAGSKAWRLPTKDELRGIVVKSKKKPMTDTAAFPNTPSAMFWATRPGFTDNLNAWLVHFGNGRVYGNTNAGKFYLRLVRANS